MILLKLLDSRFSVLRMFIPKYRTVQSMHEKLGKIAEKTVSSSGFEKKTIAFNNTTASSVYLRDKGSMLKEQILGTMDDELIHSSYNGEKLSLVKNAATSPKASQPLK